MSVTYYENGDIKSTVIYKESSIISGRCGSNGRQWNNAEMSNYERKVNYPKCP